MKSTESDVCYFEVDAVFNREPEELRQLRANARESERTKPAGECHTHTRTDGQVENIVPRRT